MTAVLRDALRGLGAGAAGTVTLNIVTYGDMALRGRPPSSTPQHIAATLARWARLLPLEDVPGSNPPQAQHRETAFGALMGYATGLGVGALYGVLQPRVNLPLVVGGLAAGMLTEAASDSTAIAIAGSNPKTWGLSGWLEDLIPHAAYGLMVALVYRALRER
ncbi:MAG TPA: hypothetical protein VF116_19390 [Ktedonobacterales bacterium]